MANDEAAKLLAKGLMGDSEGSVVGSRWVTWRISHIRLLENEVAAGTDIQYQGHPAVDLAWVYGGCPPCEWMKEYRQRHLTEI